MVPSPHSDMGHREHFAGSRPELVRVLHREILPRRRRVWTFPRCSLLFIDVV
jgi:hypothetical protein